MGTSSKKGSVASGVPYRGQGPAQISFGAMTFLITERPTDYNIRQYVEELKRQKVIAVVRVCEPSYKTEPLTEAGIRVLDWVFDDGSAPPKEVRDQWIGLAKDTFAAVKGATLNDPCCIAVHCVAGLGRAPVLVALALMEAGMKYEDAVDLIRNERRGAINQKQLTFLQKYKASGQLKKFNKCPPNTTTGENKCSIM